MNAQILMENVAIMARFTISLKVGWPLKQSGQFSWGHIGFVFRDINRIEISATSIHVQKSVWRLFIQSIHCMLSQPSPKNFFSLLAHTVPDYHLDSFFYLAHRDSLPTSRASTKNPQEALFNSCQIRKEPGQKYKLPLDFSCWFQPLSVLLKVPISIFHMYIIDQITSFTSTAL